MKLSVILPTYKPQNYLWKCLDSLDKQTMSHDEFEVLLVLNGCAEPYLSEIKLYLSKHPELNVILIHTEQGGVSNARNLALDLAKGEYVTFIDDDDYISNTYLKALLNKANQNTIVLSDVYAFYDGSTERIPYRISNVYKKLSSIGFQYFINAWKYFSGPCYKLIPRNFIGNKRFDPSFTLGEDTLFMFQISDKFSNVDFSVSDVFYYRRIRSGSAMTKKRNRRKIIKNELRLLFAIISTYIPFFWKYNFRYALLNVLSVFHGIIKAI